jgi:hypothetical protein
MLMLQPVKLTIQSATLAPYDFCGNTHAMMAGAKAVDYDHKEQGIEQTHTWNSMTKTCTPIIYSQPSTESDME